MLPTFLLPGWKYRSQDGGGFDTVYILCGMADGKIRPGFDNRFRSGWGRNIRSLCTMYVNSKQGWRNKFAKLIEALESLNVFPPVAV